MYDKTETPPANLKNVADKNETKKIRVLSAVTGNSRSQLTDRVAWVLHHYPSAHPKDIFAVKFLAYFGLVYRDQNLTSSANV